MQDYFKTFEEFIAANPEIDPACVELLRPIYNAEQKNIMSFIMFYLFM